MNRNIQNLFALLTFFFSVVALNGANANDYNIDQKSKKTIEINFSALDTLNPITNYVNNDAIEPDKENYNIPQPEQYNIPRPKQEFEPIRSDKKIFDIQRDYTRQKPQEIQTKPVQKKKNIFSWISDKINSPKKVENKSDINEIVSEIEEKDSYLKSIRDKNRNNDNKNKRISTIGDLVASLVGRDDDSGDDVERGGDYALKNNNFVPNRGDYTAKRNDYAIRRSDDIAKQQPSYQQINNDDSPISVKIERGVIKEYDLKPIEISESQTQPYRPITQTKIATNPPVINTPPIATRPPVITPQRPKMVPFEIAERENLIYDAGDTSENDYNYAYDSPELVDDEVFTEIYNSDTDFDRYNDLNFNRAITENQIRQNANNNANIEKIDPFNDNYTKLNRGLDNRPRREIANKSNFYKPDPEFLRINNLDKLKAEDEYLTKIENLDHSDFIYDKSDEIANMDLEKINQQNQFYSDRQAALTLSFIDDTSDLDQESKEKLTNFIASLNRGDRVEVLSFISTDAYNSEKRLSLRRTIEIRNIFTENNLNRENITIKPAVTTQILENVGKVNILLTLNLGG